MDGQGYAAANIEASMGVRRQDIPADTALVLFVCVSKKRSHLTW